MLVVTNAHDAASQTRSASRCKCISDSRRLRVTYVGTTDKVRRHAEFQIGIIIVFLKILRLLLALVGGLGLMGTMSSKFDNSYSGMYTVYSIHVVGRLFVIGDTWLPVH